MRLRELLAAIALVACQRDDRPLERLPAPPPPAIAPRLVPPPPPPPPPREATIDPPAAIATAIAAPPCAAWIDGVRLADDRASALVERLGQRASWLDGVNGCVSKAIEIRLECNGRSIAFTTDCGNVSVSGTTVAWAPAMSEWFATIRPGDRAAP